MDAYLEQNYDKSECQQAVELFRKSHNVPEARKEAIDAVLQIVKSQMDADLKTAELKNFQALLWKEAFESGQVRGDVYDDVVRALKDWTDAKIPVYIYSSGSISAQKLIFGYSSHGDLLRYLSGHFDLSTGKKTESSSYRKIADAIRVAPKEILFLSDNPKEITAAQEVNYQTRLVTRPSKDVITSFDQVF